MEKSIRFIAMLAACFVIYTFLPSCKNRPNFTGKKLAGAIFITGYDTSDSSLTLIDSATKNNATYVLVSRTQPISWVNKASKIEILEIAADPQYHPNDPAFFSPTDVPHRIGNSPRWSAAIGSPANNGILIEKYYIKWKLKTGGPDYSFDPLMQLNPQ